MKRIHHGQSTREQELVLDLDEIARQGAQKMLAQALQAEVDAYLKAAEAGRDQHGHALVVKNGYHNARQVLPLEGHGGVAAALPARALDWRLRAGPRGVLRDWSGIVAREHNPPFRAVAKRRGRGTLGGCRPTARDVPSAVGRD